jgi:hypothetical protein
VESKPAGEKILERLTHAQAPTPVEVPASEPAERFDEKKLEALTKAEPAPTPAKAPPVPEAKQDLSKADEKLSGLLGKKP